MWKVHIEGNYLEVIMFSACFFINWYMLSGRVINSFMRNGRTYNLGCKELFHKWLEILQKLYMYYYWCQHISVSNSGFNGFLSEWPLCRQQPLYKRSTSVIFLSWYQKCSHWCVFHNSMIWNHKLYIRYVSINMTIYLILLCFAFVDSDYWRILYAVLSIFPMLASLVLTQMWHCQRTNVKDAGKSNSTK